MSIGFLLIGPLPVSLPNFVARNGFATWTREPDRRSTWEKGAIVLFDASQPTNDNIVFVSWRNSSGVVVSCASLNRFQPSAYANHWRPVHSFLSIDIRPQMSVQCWVMIAICILVRLGFAHYLFWISNKNITKQNWRIATQALSRQHTHTRFDGNAFANFDFCTFLCCMPLLMFVYSVRAQSLRFYSHSLSLEVVVAVLRRQRRYPEWVSERADCTAITR